MSKNKRNLCECGHARSVHAEQGCKHVHKIPVPKRNPLIKPDYVQAQCACKRYSAQTSQGVRNLDGPQVNARRMPDEHGCFHNYSWKSESYDYIADRDVGYLLCSRCGHKDHMITTASLPF